MKYLFFNKLQAKSLDMEYTFQWKMFLQFPREKRKPANDPKIKQFVTFSEIFCEISDLLRGLLLCEHSTTSKLGFN